MYLTPSQREAAGLPPYKEDWTSAFGSRSTLARDSASDARDARPPMTTACGWAGFDHGGGQLTTGGGRSTKAFKDELCAVCVVCPPPTLQGCCDGLANPLPPHPTSITPQMEGAKHGAAHGCWHPARRPSTQASRVALLISGHLRGALGFPALRQAVRGLRSQYPGAATFVHTWSSDEAAASWRKLPVSSHGSTPVTAAAVCDYLGFTPDGLLVEVEQWAVQLEGVKDPTVRLFGSCPLLCYKSLWYSLCAAFGLCARHERREGGARFDCVLRLRADYHRLIRQPDMTPPRWDVGRLLPLLEACTSSALDASLRRRAVIFPPLKKGVVACDCTFAATRPVHAATSIGVSMWQCLDPG